MEWNDFNDFVFERFQSLICIIFFTLILVSFHIKFKFNVINKCNKYYKWHFWTFNVDLLNQSVLLSFYICLILTFAFFFLLLFQSLLFVAVHLHQRRNFTFPTKLEDFFCFVSSQCSQIFVYSCRSQDLS